MPHHKEVVFAFAWFAVTRHIAIMRFVQERLRTPREHLVTVALVAHVIDNLVFRGFKNVMECNRRFYKSEVRPHMSTALGKFFDDGCTHFGCKLFETVDVQRFHVGRGLDVF